MSARVYFMNTVNGCKDVSTMSPQDEQRRRTSLLCLYNCNLLVLLITTVCSRTNCKHSRRKYYGLQLSQSRYHYTKSKNYLRRRYRIRR